jgi:GDP-4-dehydro-6-deoxy-D-mannose reductase
MRVMVTGAGGFVGRRLVPRLRAEGHAVAPSDRELDVSDAARVRSAMADAKPDAIVHLAALSFVPDSLADPRAAFRVNFLGARAVLEAMAREAPGARLLLVGTSQVYGSAKPGEPPFDEETPLRPASPYAWAKAAADLLGGVHARRGLDVLRLRPFNHTGPGRPDHFVESSLARQLAEIEVGRRPPVLRVGNLDAVRDFLHVDDVVDAYVRLLAGGAPPGVYNVASGEGTSIRQLLAALLSASPAGERVEVQVDPALWRPTEASVGSARRLARATGWAPRVAASELFPALLAHWREVVGGHPG